MQKSKIKIVAIAFLMFFSGFGFTFAQGQYDFYATGTIRSQSVPTGQTPCVPNRAVYPDGNDPNCINGFYRLDYIPSQSRGGVVPPVGSQGSSNSFSVGGNIFSLSSCSLTAPRNFKELVMNIFVGCIIRPLIPLVMALTLLVFLWGIFKFIRAEDDTGKAEGRKFIIWGIVGLFVMVSFWGLVAILQYTFRLDASSLNVRPVNVGGF